VYVPVTGEITGTVATGKLIVITDVATGLLEKAPPAAIAFTVVVAPTGIAAVYTVELVVGVEPSSV
jgi:hypothetical protein